MPHLPAILTKEELLSVLAMVQHRIEEDDSFEGFIEYLIPDAIEDIEKGKFAVTARFRIGNSEGQGGMSVVGTFA